MMHDFIATDNYAIFFVCPSVFHLENAAAGKPMLRLGAAARHQDRRDEPQDRRCEMVPRRGVLRFSFPQRVRGERLARCRWMPDGVARHVRQLVRRQAGDAVAMEPEFERTARCASSTDRRRLQEFPRFDERIAGRKHRYGYFAGGDVISPENETSFKALLKRDYQTGKFEVHDLGKNFAPGEPVFVPRNAKSSEDDGWVLAVWYDAELNRSEMVVLDAQNFAGAPVARIKLQHRVPWGFHGNWVPAQ